MLDPISDEDVVAMRMLLSNRSTHEQFLNYIGAVLEPDRSEPPSPVVFGDPWDGLAKELPSTGLELCLCRSDGTNVPTSVIGGFRYGPRGPLILLCRDARFTPPRHFCVCLEKGSYSVVGAEDDRHLPVQNWPWFADMRAKNKFKVRRRRALCRKVTIEEIQRAFSQVSTLR